MAVLALGLKIWKPKGSIKLEGDKDVAAAAPHHSGKELFMAWSPYLLLVVFVMIWGMEPFKTWLNSVTFAFRWPGLHNQILRVPPVVAKPAPYAASFTLNWLSAAGTSCMLAAIFSLLVLRLSPRRSCALLGATIKQ